MGAALLLAVALLAAPRPAAGQQSSAHIELKTIPREEPGGLPGYCPSRGGGARDWRQAGNIEGCTMLDLYSQGLNATTMTELSVVLALEGAQVTWLELARQMLVVTDGERDSQDTEGIRATAELLDANRQVNTIRLGENRLGPAHAAALAPALNGKSGLAKLLLDKNQLGAEGAAFLAEALASPTAHATELDLASNALGDEGAAAIGAALLTAPSLVILSLEDNGIGADGVAPSFGDALKVNSQLERLVLRLNSIGNSGAAAIAEGLAGNPASALLSIDLFGNDLGDSAAEAFASALRVPGVQIQELGLAKNEIGDDGAVALSAALQSNLALPLRTLVLAGNHIGSIGSKALLKALQSNTMLTTLDVRQHNSPEMKELLKQIKPELACNAALAQSPNWYEDNNQRAMRTLLMDGADKVDAIAAAWKPSVYRLGPSKPLPLDEVDACVAKAMRLQKDVASALFLAGVQGGGKRLRDYSHVSHDDINTQAGEARPKEDL